MTPPAARGRTVVDGVTGMTELSPTLDVDAVRAHFDFVARGRVPTNSAASTQVPRDLLELLADLAPGYENVHRGQSRASRETTEVFETAYDDIAAFIGAPSRRNLVLTRNTTEAVNAVMYSLLTQFRDGDNVVTTLMEHNSNYVPWHALCRELLPSFGVYVECRLARFDRHTGELDLAHLASLVDSRTKLVAVTGASNFLGSKPALDVIRVLTRTSGYQQPDGREGSLLLVDGAQLVPSTHVDVAALDVDYLAFSFHKILAPFGVGVLYAREDLLASSPPFLFGGDMIAEGQVYPDRVEYNDLPWRYAAGTPNILGTVLSAQALRLLLDLALDPAGPPRHFRTTEPIRPEVVREAMGRITRHTRSLTAQALEGLRGIPGTTIYGPRDAARRSPLVAFNVAGHDPRALAEALDADGVESRAGCHCATLAHHALGLDPPASCRVSFFVYTSPEEVERAVGSLERAVRSGTPPVLTRS